MSEHNFEYKFETIFMVAKMERWWFELKYVFTELPNGTVLLEKCIKSCKIVHYLTNSFTTAERQELASLEIFEISASLLAIMMTFQIF